MNDESENVAALDARPWTLDAPRKLTSDHWLLTSEKAMRKTWATWILFAAFAGCITFAYAWFNTDIGPSDSQLSTSDSQPRIWLEARTNIPGLQLRSRTT